MRSKRFFAILILLFPLLTLQARQADDTVLSLAGDDTLSVIPSASKKEMIFQHGMVGVPLLVGGLLIKGEDTHFRSLRNDYFPFYRAHFDDVMQYVPLATLYGMKAVGIKSRSKWGRMVASNTIAAAIMGATVNTVKHSANVMRPDGTDNHSFPSGHTALAFLSATMLTKEYGNRYPWIGIAAYSAATATGMMRIINNKHWLSDVVSGAGIGILSAEAGYLIADMLFKNKGLESTFPSTPLERFRNPSFVGLYVGLNLPASHFDFTDNITFATSMGSSAGFEGAYFFNPYIGVGGRATVSNYRVIINQQAETNTVDALQLAAGAYFSYPLSQRFRIGSKALVSHNHFAQTKFSATTMPATKRVGLHSGVSISYQTTHRYGVSLFCDYNLIQAQSPQSKEWVHGFVPGTLFFLSF